MNTLTFYGTAPAIVLLVALVARIAPLPPMDRLEAALASARAPWVLGAVSAVVVAIVFGSLDQVAVVHDERAFLLQAEIFGSGHWTAPSPPLPEFFEQLHVFVTPAVASKYPPGHSLLMIPFVMLGVPGLMPVLLAGIGGALTFALARKIVGVWTALLTWFLWSTAPGTLSWYASYFSETTTTALMLGAWWGLLRWRERHSRRDLVIVAACVGLGAITRPLTMLALAVPMAIVVLRDVVARHAWRDATVAGVVGLAILLILPLHAYETTGKWRPMPITTYTEMYMPWEKLGFGDVDARPQRPLPEDLADVVNGFRGMHRDYTASQLPGALRERSLHIATDVWGHVWRSGLILFAGVGLFVMPPAIAFAFLSSLLVLLAYLAYAQGAGWTVYYVEMYPALCVVTALGVARVVKWVVAVGPHSSGTDALTSPAERRFAFAVAVLVVVALYPATLDVIIKQADKQEWTLYHRYFRELLAQIKEPRALVFVRYAPHHSGHMSLVGNVAEMRTARVLTAYDRGADDDARLAAMFPDRVPLLYDEASLELMPLSRAPATAPPTRAP